MSIPWVARAAGLEPASPDFQSAALPIELHPQIKDGQRYRGVGQAPRRPEPLPGGGDDKGEGPGGGTNPRW